MSRGGDPETPADPSAGDGGLPETVIERRSARKDGREVAALTCLVDGGAYVVECEVRPMHGARGHAISRGPYRFATLGEANAFLDEAGRALEYLGCHVS